MEIIAIAESDDCGPFAVMDTGLITIVKIVNTYFAAVRCSFRNTPITCEIGIEDAQELMFKGVRCLDISEENMGIFHEEN